MSTRSVRHQMLTRYRLAYARKLKRKLSFLVDDLAVAIAAAAGGGTKPRDITCASRIFQNPTELREALHSTL